MQQHDTAVLFTSPSVNCLRTVLLETLIVVLQTENYRALYATRRYSRTITSPSDNCLKTVLLETLIVVLQTENYPALYATTLYISVFTKAPSLLLAQSQMNPFPRPHSLEDSRWGFFVEDVCSSTVKRVAKIEKR